MTKKQTGSYRSLRNYTEVVDKHNGSTQNYEDFTYKAVSAFKVRNHGGLEYRLVSSSQTVYDPATGTFRPSRRSNRPPKLYENRVYRKMVWKKFPAPPKTEKTVFKRTRAWEAISAGEAADIVGQGDYVERQARGFIKVRWFKGSWHKKVVKRVELRRVPLVPPKPMFRWQRVEKVKVKRRRLWVNISSKTAKSLLSPTSYRAMGYTVRSTVSGPLAVIDGAHSITTIRSEVHGALYAAHNFVTYGGTPMLFSSDTDMGYVIETGMLSTSVGYTDHVEDLQLLTDRATRRFYKKLKRDAANIANYFSPEGAKAYKQLRSIVVRLVTALNGLRQANAKKFFSAIFDDSSRSPISLARFVAEHHLAYVYGLKPLMEDWNASLSAFDKPFDLVFTTKSSARLDYRSDSLVSLGAGTYHSSRTRDTSTTSSLRVGISGTVRIEKPQTALAAQFGLTQVLPTVWENIPFSFLVDWIIQIGDFLDHQATLTGLSVEELTLSTLNKGGVIVVDTFTGPINGNTIDSRQSGSGSRFAYDRSLMSELPAYPVPTIKSPLSLQHFANAMALLRVLVRG